MPVYTLDENTLNTTAKQLLQVEIVPQPPKEGASKEEKNKWEGFAAYKELLTTEITYLNAMESRINLLNGKSPKTSQDRQEINQLQSLSNKGSELLTTLYTADPKQWMAKLASLEQPFKQYYEFNAQNSGKVLLEPVQRLPRYNLLFKELVKHLDDNKKMEFSPLTVQSSEIANAVNSHLNKTIIKDDSTDKTIAIMDKIKKSNKDKKIDAVLSNIIVDLKQEGLNPPDRVFKNVLQTALAQQSLSDKESKKLDNSIIKIFEKKITKEDLTTLGMRSQASIKTWVDTAKEGAAEYLQARAQAKIAQSERKEEPQKAQPTERRPAPFVMGGHRADKPKPFLANVTKPEIAPDEKKPTLGTHRNK